METFPTLNDIFKHISINSEGKLQLGSANGFNVSFGADESGEPTVKVDGLKQLVASLDPRLGKIIHQAASVYGQIQNEPAKAQIPETPKETIHFSSDKPCDQCGAPFNQDIDVKDTVVAPGAGEHGEDLRLADATCGYCNTGKQVLYTINIGETEVKNSTVELKSTQKKESSSDDLKVISKEDASLPTGWEEKEYRYSKEEQQAVVSKMRELGLVSDEEIIQTHIQNIQEIKQQVDKLDTHINLAKHNLRMRLQEEKYSLTNTLKKESHTLNKYIRIFCRYFRSAKSKDVNNIIQDFSRDMYELMKIGFFSTETEYKYFYKFRSTIIQIIKGDLPPDKSFLKYADEVYRFIPDRYVKLSE